MKIKIICKHCGKDHFVEQREVNRGGGIFCSNSCGALFNNTHRKYHDLTCQNPICSKTFTGKNSTTKFCSKQCNYACKKKQTGKSYCTRSTLSKRIRKAIGDENFKCFICDWKEDACDIHHIIPRSSGGTNEFDNLTVLCPNHHRLADRKLLVSMPTVSDRDRTISSSDEKSELDAVSGN